MFDFRLLNNASFSLYVITTFLIFLGHLMPYVYLPLQGRSLGYAKQESAFLVSILGEDVELLQLYILTYKHVFFCGNNVRGLKSYSY